MPRTRAARTPGGLAPLLTPLLLALALATPRPAAAQLGTLLPGISPDTTALNLSPANLIAGSLGITSFSGGLADGEYLTLTLQPEIDLSAIGLNDVGFGVYAPLRFQIVAGDDTSASGGFRFREEDYDDPGEILSIIRYVRYGQKNGDQSLYARFGLLDGANVGYGSMLSFYRNEVGNDQRRRGLAFDVDAGMLGVETVFGSFSNPGVYAARGYVRPFWQPSEAGGGFGLSALAVGLTLAGDVDPTGGYVNPDSSGAPFFLSNDESGTPPPAGAVVARDDGALTTVGVDLAMPFVQGDGFALAAFADVSKILDYGWGGGAGLGLALTPPAGLARIDARLELRYLGAHYIPRYFNAFYEVDRIRVVDSVAVPVDSGGTRMVPRFQTRRNELLAQDESYGGLFGTLGATFLGLFHLEGTYQQLFEDGGTGWFHLGGTLGRPGRDLVVGRLGFDVWNIGGSRETLTTTSDMLFQAEVSTGLIRYVQLGLVYENAFQPIFDDVDSGKVLGHRRQTRFEPRVQLLLPF